MPSPSTTLASLRPDLGGSFEEFDLDMNRRGMIALDLFRVMETQVQAGSFGKVPIESLLQAIDTKRAPGSAYNRSKFTFTDAKFATAEHGVEEPVDDRESKMYANYFVAEQVAASRARNMVMEGLEQRVATLAQDTATLADTAVTVKWDVPATATPITDVEGAMQRLFDKGIIGNALVVGWKTFRNLRLVKQIQDAIAAQGAGDKITARQINIDKLKSVFDIDHILVAGMIKNTANEAQAASISTVFDNTIATVTRIAETDDIREPCFGRVFHWGEDGSDIGGTMESYRDETVRGDVIRARMDTDETVLYIEAAELLTGVA